LKKEITFYQGETKIAYWFLKCGFWLIKIYEGVAAIADGRDTGNCRLGLLIYYTVITSHWSLK